MTDLFRFLVESKTILSMQLPESEYERLTCVIDIRQTGKANQLIIDSPHDFQKAAENKTDLKLHFNFNGPDKLEYIFTTKGVTYDSKGLLLPFPEYVERLQRRGDFRLQTPPGTQMHFQCKEMTGKFDLINISLGGTYGVLRLKGSVNSKQPLLKVKQSVFKAVIRFYGQSPENTQEINIQKAEVVRIEKDKEKYRHRYAFKFKYIEKEEKQKLINTIYRLQREYLQRR
jgi:c-di-GMP-binding flagellar brake protein YcgR